MIGWCLFLYFIGLFMVCLEIFIPGGIVGACGVISIGTSFWIAYSKIGHLFGSYFVSGGLIVAIVCILLSIRLFPRTRASRKVFLNSHERDFKATSPELKELQGKKGVTLTKLRPAGMISIDGRRINVVSETSFVDSGVKVKVVKVEGNRVVVRKQKAADEKGKKKGVKKK